MVKKPTEGPCQVVVSQERFTDLLILRAVKCGEDGRLVRHRSLPESGLLMCPAHEYSRFRVDKP